MSVCTSSCPAGLNLSWPAQRKLRDDERERGEKGIKNRRKVRDVRLSSEVREKSRADWGKVQ